LSTFHRLKIFAIVKQHDNVYTTTPSSRSSDPALMTGRPRLRRIIHQLTEKGTARLIYDEECRTLRGVLLNNVQDTFSIHGKPTSSTIGTIAEITNGSSDDGKSPSTSEDRMQITIVDGETGDKYQIEDVTIEVSELVNPITNSSHHAVNIDHPAIKFQTKEVLIGNRADVEISQFIDPELSPISSKKVLIGNMTLKVVAREKTQPTIRRMSESVNISNDVVIEQTTDFLA